MKFMLCCSTAFYDKVEEISKYLIDKGYEVEYPNGYLENNYEINDNVTDEEYSKFFKDMFQESIDKIKTCDGIIVLNYDKVKDGVVKPNYIGASTFLEMYEAFMNDYPDNMLLDEIKGFNPIILYGDINNFK